MKTPLSQNEMEALDRQVATINYQLSEIANLLESRLGAATELASSARATQQEFAKLARRIHVQATVSGQDRASSKSSGAA